MPSVPNVKIDYYYDYVELCKALHNLAGSAPGLCRMHSIGTTHEGRDIPVLEITDFNSGVPEEKPGYYVEACTHAEEFCGTNIALNLIKTLLGSFGEREDITLLLKNVIFYIVPRVNPDGVDTVMKTGYPGVSNGKYPIDERQTLPGLYPTDLDGNHIVAQMRIPDPDGEWKVSKKDPRLMIIREPYETEGQFYRMYPEGLIRGDTAGFDIPLTKDVNLNRNYPAGWMPEGMQYGACELPLSEPETNSVAHFIVAHPNIAGVISYHTNAGSILRPFSNKSDDCFLGSDLAIYNALGNMGTKLLGYNFMSTYGGFTPDKTKMRGGTLNDWTFEFMGIPALCLELWNVYDAAGTPRPKNYHFSAKDEDTDYAVLQWADREMGPSAYLDWKPFDHPQLGRVEIGGWTRIWVERNPPEKYLPDFADKATVYTLRLAEALPRLTIQSAKAEKLAEDLYKVSIVVRNSGYLPTYLTTQAKSVHADSPIKIFLLPQSGSFEVECCDHPIDIGHLEGRFGRDAEWSHDRNQWYPTERRAEWVIRTNDCKALDFTASSPRCGAVHTTILL